MCQVDRREILGRSKRNLVTVRLIFSGDGYEDEAQLQQSALESFGHPVVVTQANGCTQLEYVDDRRHQHTLYDYEGERLTLAAIARRKGMNPESMYARVVYWGLSEAIRRPKTTREENRASFLKKVHGFIGSLTERKS